MTGYFGAYATIAILLLLGLAFVTVAFTANRLLRPDPRDRLSRPERYLTYECGVDPVGGDWSQTQVRYYVFAFLYVVFAVESVFLFPWATVYDSPGFGVRALAEMGVFIGLLAVGLLYAWRKKVLEWV